MFYEIFKFELLYRAKRAETYLYFTILFVCSIVAVNFLFQGTAQTVTPDAPYIIAYTMAATSAIFTMIASMIMGVSILRDFDHRMESLMFVNPIQKREYLMGRFLGSFTVLLLVFIGLPLGMILGHFMPWRSSTELLPVIFRHYLQPFLYMVVPNLFFAGSLFFVSGALSRKLIVVYTQGIILLVAYILISIVAKNPDGSDLSGLLDPFALNTINRVIEYWTVAERNTVLLPLTGLLLYNRLIWIGAGIVALIIGYFGFSFNIVRTGSIHLKTVPGKPKLSIPDQVLLPKTALSFDAETKLIQLLHQSFFHFTSLLKEIPFWAISICGAAIIFVNGVSLGTSHGVNSFPTTYLIVEELQELSIPFFLLILIFYSGELVWKERDLRINLIYDALPTSNLVNLSAKLIGIILTYATLLLALCASGVLMQSLSGFYDYELPVYFVGFFVEVLPFLMIYTIASFFFQVAINHKFMAHLVSLVFFIATLAFQAFGYDHALIRFGGDTLGIYSEMNGYGHFMKPYLWIKTYWLAFSSLFFLVAALYSVRGTETLLKVRWRTSWQQLTKSTVLFGSFALLFFIISGSWIFHNTNILNQYDSQFSQETMQAAYERTLKKYEYIPQPKVVDVKLKLDLYPHERDYVVEGQYILVNKEHFPINEIHIQQVPSNQVDLESVRFNRPIDKTEALDNFGYTIYSLHEALQPGDSVNLAFKQTFATHGFVSGESVTEVVYNGTYLRNTNFPSIGYNRYFELTEEKLRKEHKLAPRSSRAKRENPYELKNGISGDDGYEIAFEITVSTDSSQVAVAPGNLKNEWLEGSRRYFHYKMEQPMINFYSIVSAEYAVLRDQWTPTDPSFGKPVDLEIYYHKTHTYNLDRMMQSMKASFDYFTRHFGSYGYEQMRIMEYPRYRRYAQSLPGTVPFSEALGFILDIDDQKDVDMAFYVTAHELAHQWWGLQVVAANVKGKDLILESLAQYSALMVLRETYGEENVVQFLETQLKEYLRGSSSKTESEKPLSLVEGNPYIYYNKGAINLYAFQDYISEEKVNLALREFIQDWNAFGEAFQQDRYATTSDLMEYFQEVTPDSLRYVITDLFETITSYDNSISKAEYDKVSEDSYKTWITVDTQKYSMDSMGVETAIKVNDWIDIGIFTANEDGKDECLHLEKHQITSQITSLEIEVDRLPTKVIIDPKHLLIDKNRKDNAGQISQHSLNERML